MNVLSRRTKRGTSMPRHLRMLIVLYAATSQRLGIFNKEILLFRQDPIIMWLIERKLGLNRLQFLKG